MLHKIVTSAVATVTGGPEAARAKARRSAIRRAAKIGGTMFGDIPAGVNREFFCLDKHTWIWHEDWVDASGTQQVRMVRYDVRPHGIFKSQEGHARQRVNYEEARNLLDAARTYHELVSQELALA